MTGFEQLLTLDQVADWLQVHRRTVQRLVERGDLVAVQVAGAATRVDPADVREYVDRQKHGGNVPYRTAARVRKQPLRAVPSGPFADRLRQGAE